MQDYILDSIVANKLPYSGLASDHAVDYDLTKAADRVHVKKGNLKAGLQPMAYFFFKLAYENDRRYGMERVEQFDNFEEYLPIVVVQ